MIQIVRLASNDDMIMRRKNETWVVNEMEMAAMGRDFVIREYKSHLKGEEDISHTAEARELGAAECRGGFSGLQGWRKALLKLMPHSLLRRGPRCDTSTSTMLAAHRSWGCFCCSSYDCCSFSFNLTETNNATLSIVSQSWEIVNPDNIALRGVFPDGESAHNVA